MLTFTPWFRDVHCCVQFSTWSSETVTAEKCKLRFLNYANPVLTDIWTTDEEYRVVAAEQILGKK